MVLSVVVPFGVPVNVDVFGRRLGGWVSVAVHLKVNSPDVFEVVILLRTQWGRAEQ